MKKQRHAKEPLLCDNGSFYGESMQYIRILRGGNFMFFFTALRSVKGGCPAAALGDSHRV
jgi:hypothetical protein